MAASGSDVELKEHVEALIAAQEKYLEARIAALDEKANIASRTAETVRHDQNEWRQALNDFARTLMSRNEWQTQHATMESRVARVEKLAWTGLGIALLFGAILGAYSHR